MSLTSEERAALKAHWLGEKLPSELERVLHGVPSGEVEVVRRQEMSAYLAELGEEASRQARRLALVYGPLAMGKLVELMQGESGELSRKAAVDLLKRLDEARDEERAERAVRVTREQGLLAASVSEGESRQILAILADAFGRAAGGGGGGSEKVEK